MGGINEFDKVSRHYAVQSLLNACYAETLQATARFLHGERPACACRPGAVLHNLQQNGVLPTTGMEALRTSCENCRQSLERAAAAWECGEPEALRQRLVEYRVAAGAVRSELLRLVR